MNHTNRKETAWKKSRKFGDIKGGRRRRRMEDNIFSRAHTLKAPGINDDLPIMMRDNPSSDFFYPLESDEVLAAIRALPKIDFVQITHIWLRRISRSDYRNGDSPFAEFICGSGVRLIVIYPWPKDHLLRLGRSKPAKSVLKQYEKWCQNLVKVKGEWGLLWDLEPLRLFYIQQLIYHEVGHHVDAYYRHWSKANRVQVEDAADQYAFLKTATSLEVFNRLEEQRKLHGHGI